MGVIHHHHHPILLDQTSGGVHPRHAVTRLISMLVLPNEYYPSAPSGASIASPAYRGSAFRALFRWVVFAGFCLAILWLILLDLVKFVLGSWP